MATCPIFVDGVWRAAQATGIFSAQNPSTGERLPDEYPVSSWADCDAALSAAADSALALRETDPARIAAFLTTYANRLDARKDELARLAHLESGLPKAPRLADVELPRTTDQLRQAAAAAVEGSWALPTIDAKANIRSCYAP